MKLKSTIDYLMPLISIHLHYLFKLAVMAFWTIHLSNLLHFSMSCNIVYTYVHLIENNESVTFVFLISHLTVLLSVFYTWLHCDLFSEQMRQTDRIIKKTQRDMERERAELERQEKKLVSFSLNYFKLCCWCRWSDLCHLLSN